VKILSFPAYETALKKKSLCNFPGFAHFMRMVTLPPGEFAAYIFDCDGTLADSMPSHFRAWTRTLGEFSKDIVYTEATFYEWGGKPTLQIVKDLNDLYPEATPLDPALIMKIKELYFLEEMALIQPIDPIVAIARQAKAEHKAVAVASGGILHVVEETLANIGLKDFFPIIVTPVDVARGKPAPDMYLLAAEKMGVKPEQCLVFEDSPTGIEAARAAGMAWVLVPSHPPLSSQN
jgi:HAD superfamily hydrolase (TIGR01509 family)